jgi:hypothetical protein
VALNIREKLDSLRGGHLERDVSQTDYEALAFTLNVGGSCGEQVLSDLHSCLALLELVAHRVVVDMLAPAERCTQPPVSERNRSALMDRPDLLFLVRRQGFEPRTR